MVDSVVTSVLVLLVVAYGLRLMVGGFNPRLAAVRVNSIRGANLAALLAVGTVIEVVLDTGPNLVSRGLGVDEMGGLIALLLIGAIGAIAFFTETALVIFSIVGIGAFGYNVFVEHGPSALLSVVVVGALSLMVFSLARGVSTVR